MLKAYKYRIYPTPHQTVEIDKTFAACRLVYNIALEVKITAYKSARISVNKFELMRQLQGLKEAAPWLRDVNSQALYAAIDNMDKAYTSFFRGGGYPRFKSKKKGTQSYQCKNGRRKIDWHKSLLALPKIKDIPIRLSHRFNGQIKTITIQKTPTGKYFASVLVDNGVNLPFKVAIKPDSTVGIDIGIKSYAICSNGLSFEPNRYLKNSLKRLQCLQRRASRKKKGSNNRNKANKCVAILHERIANQRSNYIHKITSELMRDNQASAFVIEDLNVAGMKKNRKLSQAIFDVSFSEFRRQMQYKCEWHGKNLIVIDRFAPSSKRCSNCGEINHELTLSDRDWTCVCGSYHDRDLNAAKNIKWFGLQQTIFKKQSPEGIGEEPVESRRIRRAKKQETMPNQ